MAASGFVALAVTTKYSAIPFLGLALVLFGVYRWRSGRALPPARQSAAAGALALLFCWCVFGFETGIALTDDYDAAEKLERALGENAAVRAVGGWAIEVAQTTPLPLASMLGGVGYVAVHGRLGHKAFLLGEASRSGG